MQLDHLLAGSNLVIPELLQKAIADLGQVKQTQDKMESPKQQVFTYHHNVSNAGNFDKVVGHNQYSVVFDNHNENAVVHNLQSLVAQVLNRLDIDQIQSKLVSQAQTKVGFSGIVVVGTSLLDHLLLPNIRELTKLWIDHTRRCLSHSK